MQFRAKHGNALEDAYNSDMFDKSSNRFKDSANGTLIYIHGNKRLYIIMDNELVPVTPAKREIIEFKCKNCSQSLHTSENSSVVRCEYCDSVYDVDNWR